jgi:CRISPR-associated protein Csy1
MTNTSPERRTAFRTAIEGFLQERLAGKLEKLKPDDPKRDELAAQFVFATWIEDAASRIAQLQMATHIVKPVFPEAKIRETTNLLIRPDSLTSHPEVGSHTLDRQFVTDVVGNSAALHFYKFLRIEVAGQILLDAVLARDADLIDALGGKPEQAAAWVEAFAALMQPRGELSSHGRAKQLYWLAGDDPRDNEHFHLLAPLYASSLTHAVYQTIYNDRFGEASKAARQARRDKRDHPNGYREYPHLAVQKLGGTKPQNISQLNSERRGDNYLLASLPPQWKSRAVREPLHTDSVFPNFGRRQEVHDLVRNLKTFLASDPAPTMETRQRRESYMEGLMGELVSFAAELQTALPAGWSLDPACRLVAAEQLWLDPARAEQDEAFRSQWQQLRWPDEVGRRFANLLNSQLVDKLPMGDIEHQTWTGELLGHTEWAARIDQASRTLSQQQRHAGGAA